MKKRQNKNVYISKTKSLQFIFFLVYIIYTDGISKTEDRKYVVVSFFYCFRRQFLFGYSPVSTFSFFFFIFCSIHNTYTKHPPSLSFLFFHYATLRLNITNANNVKINSKPKKEKLTTFNITSTLITYVCMPI